MKSLIVVLQFLLPYTLFAQGVFNNQTNAAIQKVIADYPNHFKNIRGQVLMEDPQTVDFDSKVQIPGASRAVITKYNSAPGMEIYSWKCMLGESEEFEIMAKKYRDLYKQIRNSIVKIDAEKSFILNGAYEEPTEDKRFVSSIFSLLPPKGNLGKLKVELSMEYLVTEWKVSLTVYDQEEEEVVMD